MNLSKWNIETDLKCKSEGNLSGERWMGKREGAGREILLLNMLENYMETFNFMNFTYMYIYVDIHIHV